MKHIPNIITVLRILGALCLLFCNPAGAALWVIYSLCGLSDMIDGHLARKLHAESKIGLLLFCAVPTVFWSIVPIAIVACVATFASVQEGHFIRTGKV